MIWGYHYFWKHPKEYCADLVGWCLFQIDGAGGRRYFLWGSMLGIGEKEIEKHPLKLAKIHLARRPKADGTRNRKECLNMT